MIWYSWSIGGPNVPTEGVHRSRCDLHRRYRRDRPPVPASRPTATRLGSATTWRSSSRWPSSGTARRRTGNDRLAWRLIAAGIDLLGHRRPGVGRVRVPPLGATVGLLRRFLYLAGYPLMAAGIVRILMLRTPGRYREGLLDGVAFAIAAAIATWAFLVVPTTPESSLLDAVVWGAYPFADVLLLAAVAWLVLDSRPAQHADAAPPVLPERRR